MSGTQTEYKCIDSVSDLMLKQSIIKYLTETKSLIIKYM